MTTFNELANTLEAKGYSLYCKPTHLDHEGAPATPELYVEVKHLESETIVFQDNFTKEQYAEEALTDFIEGLAYTRGFIKGKFRY